MRSCNESCDKWNFPPPDFDNDQHDAKSTSQDRTISSPERQNQLAASSRNNNSSGTSGDNQDKATDKEIR